MNARLFYPYNENLPTGRAHDVYVMHNVASLARAGWDVTLGIGSESLSDEALRDHYRLKEVLPSLRFPLKGKRFWLPFASKRPFFRAAQGWIEKHRPDMVISSVFRQGEYHHGRKLQGISYVYEVHELFHAPGQQPAPAGLIEREREMLARADLVVTTTRRLAALLREPPYLLKGPIETIPLAVHAEALPKKKLGRPLTVSYVGQLYGLQGVEQLIDAVRYDGEVQLQIIGGPEVDAIRLRAYAKEVGVEGQVRVLGFQAPGRLATLLAGTDAFVMPSRKLITLPHIAHTKLLEYASWGRPLIAPRSPVVTEHLTCERGVLFYQPSDPHSMAGCFRQLREKYDELTAEIGTLAGQFSWEKRAESYSALLERFVSVEQA
jgi:glycosyltransferase involved in cell wall biosynthesis